jgi:hypothetical protein
VSSLIFVPVFAFLLMPFLVTLNMVSCHINSDDYGCGYDLEDSLKDLYLWILSIYLAGIYYWLLKSFL